LTQVQDLTFGLVELHGAHTGPLLKPVKVPLRGVPSLKHINTITEVGVTHKLADGSDYNYSNQQNKPSELLMRSLTVPELALQSNS